MFFQKCLILIMISISISLIKTQQSSKCNITGVVVDSLTQQPIELANINLKSYEDSNYYNGTATDQDGKFILKDILPGNYFISISVVGYENKLINDFLLSSEVKEVTLPKIELNKKSIELDEIETVGQKPDVEYHLDKKVINVEKSIYATSGNALEVLQNQPSVQTDSEGNIKLRGSTNFNLQVNGRPSVLSGSDGLRQIPANLISKIEIITNPSAKYEAEGSAGIINIITKQVTQSDVSGMINIGAGSRDKYNNETTINYRTSDFILTGGFDYNKRYVPIDQKLNRQTYLTDQTLFNNTKIDGNYVRKSLTFRGGVDYSISANSGIALNGVLGKVDLDRNFLFSTSNISASDSKYLLSNDNNKYDVDYIYSSIYYNNKFTPDVDELVFEASYTDLDLPSNQLSLEYVTDPNFDVKEPDPSRREFTDNTKRKSGQIKLNYSYQFDPSSKMEIGTQADFYFRNFDVVNKVFNYNKAQWEVTPEITNSFDYKNNVYGAFVTYSNTLFDFNYQLGLRAEYTNRLLEQRTVNDNFAFNKWDLFPTLNVSRKIGESQQVQFSYSRRTNRPPEQYLNPYPNFSDSYLSSVGNPELLPEYTHSLELNYQYFMPGLFLSIQTYLKLQNNAIAQSMESDSLGILHLSFTNLAKVRAEGVEVSTNIDVFPWWKINPSFNLYNSTITGEILNESVDRSEFTWTSRFISTFIIQGNTIIQLYANYFSKQIANQGTIDPFITIGASLRHSMFDKKLTLTLQAQNLFKTFKYDVEKAGDNFKTFAFVRPESPVFYLTLSYSLNNYKPSPRKPEKVDLDVNEGL